MELHTDHHRAGTRSAASPAPRPRLHRLPRPRPALDLRASSTSASTSSPRACSPSARAEGRPPRHLGAQRARTGSRFMFATAKIGVVLVTVNPVYKSHELAYVIKQSDMKALVHHRRVPRRRLRGDRARARARSWHRERGRLDSAEFPHLKALIYMGPEKHRGFYTMPELLAPRRAQPRRGAAARPRTSLDCHDVINMQYTSGTTGFPKGVMLTHHNILNNGFYIGERQKFTDGRPALPAGAALPLLRLRAGRASAALTHGATLVMLESFDPLLVLAAVQKERCTALYGVPTMFIAELDHPMFDMFDLTSLRTGIMAGSPCPIEIDAAGHRRDARREITIAYGLTEASPVFTQTRPTTRSSCSVETVGRGTPEIEVRDRRPRDRRGLPPGVPGELLCRGYNIMKGYYKMPEATGAGHRRRRLAALRRPRHGRRGRLLPHHRPDQGHDHPRRREHLPARDRGVPPTHARRPGRPGRRGRRAPSTARWWAPSSSGRTAPTSPRRTCRTSAGARSRATRRRKYVFFVDSYPMTASGKIQKYKLRELGVRLLQERGV